MSLDHCLLSKTVKELVLLAWHPEHLELLQPVRSFLRQNFLCHLGAEGLLPTSPYLRERPLLPAVLYIVISNARQNGTLAIWRGKAVNLPAFLP